MVFPPPTQSKFAFICSTSPTDACVLLVDHELDIKIVQDVIPRLPDLLTCYKRRERDSLVKSDISGVPGEPPLSRMVQALNRSRKDLWAKMRKVPSQGQPLEVPVSPHSPTRAGTKDSARSVSEAVNNLATLKLVQIAFDIIVELAKNGYSRDIAAADVIRHVIPFLTLKATFVDAPRDIRRLIMRALDCITVLSSGDELSQNKFYDEQAASKVIALMMKDDKQVIYKALRSLSTLAIDPEARKRMIENEILATVVSLIDSTAKYVSQRAMYVVAAFAVHDDGRKEVIKKNVAQKLIPRLQEDFVLSDALEVVALLAAHGTHLVPTDCRRDTFKPHAKSSSGTLDGSFGAPENIRGERGRGKQI
ncbi:hypothetical protein FRC06_009138, partial [Ceratobasidium sp. 370]